MAQVCVYLDDELATDARERAREMGTSFSKYISQLISDDCSKSKWPTAFWETYGALQDDDDFTLPDDPDISTLRPAVSFD